MAKTIRQIARSARVSIGTVQNIKNELGIEEITDENAKLIEEKAKQTTAYTDEAKKFVNAKADFEPNVRRIDQQESSSIVDLLQDCKEHYVRNERLIQQMQHEMDELGVSARANPNGTISLLPQVKSIEAFQKVNITLRNQIIDLEEKLGKTLGNETNPFD